MYREKDNFVQGEQGTKIVRFKQNLIFFIFLGVAAAIPVSFYADLVTGAAVSLGACLMAMLMKAKKTALVCLFILLSFCRASLFDATEAQIRNAENMGMPEIEREVVSYEFIFEDELDYIRGIPERVLGERGAYVAGVMFGDKTGLDDSTSEVFREAGISHILAVSGLHAGIIMGVVTGLLKNVRRSIRLPILCGFLLMLTVLSGFSPSVLRAGLMMGIYLIADTFGCRYNLLNSLCLAGTIILLAVPYNLFSAGFLLSFSATLGIALFYPYLYCYLKKWGEYIGGGTAMYISCQLTSLPVMIMVFGELSLLGVLGNLFTIPIVSFALVSGMLGMVLYPFGLSYYPFGFSAAFMEMIEYIAGAVGSVPFSTIELGEIPLILAALYYGIIGGLCCFVFKDRKPVYTALCGCMAIMLLWGITAL